MNLNNKKITLDDLTFRKAEQTEKQFILSYRRKQLISDFMYRLLESSIAAVIIFLFELTGRISTGDTDTIPSVIFFMLFLFILFNIISGGYLYVFLYLEKEDRELFVASGILTYKFKGEQLTPFIGLGAISKSINITIDSDQGAFSLPMKSKRMYRKLQLNTPVLIERRSKEGEYTYRIYPSGE